jgi:hypothetical protein
MNATKTPRTVLTIWDLILALSVRLLFTVIEHCIWYYSFLRKKQCDRAIVDYGKRETSLSMINTNSREVFKCLNSFREWW